MRRPHRELTPSPSAFRVSVLPCSRADGVGTAALHIALHYWRRLGPLRAHFVSPAWADSALWLAPMAYVVAVGLDDDFRFGACALPAPTAGDLQRYVLPVPSVSSHVSQSCRSEAYPLPPSAHYSVPLAASEPPAVAVSAWWPVSSHIPEPPLGSISLSVSSHTFPELLGASTSTPSGTPCLSHRVRAYSTHLLWQIKPHVAVSSDAKLLRKLRGCWPESL